MPRKPKTPKITIEIVIGNDQPHDEKTCFRCRLHELYIELCGTNEPRFMMLALAEASGSILSQLPEEDKHDFMMLLAKTYHEDKEEGKSYSSSGPTKH